MRAVLCSGCFDPFHYGHLRHLEEASRLGSHLFVAVTSDAAMRIERGFARPLFSAQQRRDVVAAIRFVKNAFIVENAFEALRCIERGDVFVKGPDYVGRIQPSIAQYCRENGIEIAFTSAPKWSATIVANELRHA